MPEFEITCINKLHHMSQHEHITHIGNAQRGWRLTSELAIQRIEAQNESYFTVDKQTGKKCYVGVVREQGKHPYLRTHADNKWNDNLLAQQECNGTCQVIG